MDRHDLCVGWRSYGARPHLLEPPRAPSNYKDPVKIREYIDAENARAVERAATTPGAGALIEVVAIDLATGETVFASKDSGDVSVDFASYYETFRQSVFNGAQILAFRGKKFGGILACDLLAAGQPGRRVRSIGMNVHDPCDFLRYFTPVEVKIPGKEDEVLSPTAMYQLMFPNGPALSASPSAAEEAMMVYEIQKRMSA